MCPWQTEFFVLEEPLARKTLGLHGTRMDKRIKRELVPNVS
jgi:hypothetical protein